MKKEKQVLKWLGGEDNMKRQEQLESDRVETSGQWILELAEYKSWVGEGGSTLFCSGIGIFLTGALIIRNWCW
jgi:hypothetical protein